MNTPSARGLGNKEGMVERLHELDSLRSLEAFSVIRSHLFLVLP